MKNYLLIGYNSSGYRSSIQLSFDGQIEKLYKPDPKYPDTPSTTTYFHITHANGSRTDEEHEFMDKLILAHRGYHESFLVTQVFEINQESLQACLKANDTYTVNKLIEAGVVMPKKSFLKKL